MPIHPRSAARSFKMSSVVQMQCPECDEPLKIPPSVFGKKIKCKFCQHAFVVKDPNPPSKSKSAKPNKPGKAAEKPPVASAPPPPPPPPVKQNLWDEGEADQDVSL